MYNLLAWVRLVRLLAALRVMEAVLAAQAAGLDRALIAGIGLLKSTRRTRDYGLRPQPPREPYASWFSDQLSTYIPPPRETSLAVYLPCDCRPNCDQVIEVRMKGV